MVLKKQKSKIQKRLNKLNQKGGETSNSNSPVSMPTGGMMSMSSGMPTNMFVPLPSGMMMAPPIPGLPADLMGMPSAMAGGYRKKFSRKSKQNKSRKNKSQKKGKKLTKRNRKH
jgi:hypothetical protein